MYEKKVGKAYARGCLLSCGIIVVGGILGTALVVTILLIIRGGDVEPRSPRLALALLMPLLFMAGLLAVGWLVVVLRGRRLDVAFAPWGLEGTQAGAAMRGWHGEVDRRVVDVWVHRGPTLELFLACRPATRGVIHRGGPLIRTIARTFESREPMAPPPLAMAGVSVYAHDPAWMRELLGRADARSAVETLMTGTSRAATAVMILPNAVRYLRKFGPLAEINPDNLRVWFAELGTLATAVDAVGPSRTGLDPTRLEEWARTARGKYLNRVLMGLGAFMAITLLALFVFAWLFVGRP